MHFVDNLDYEKPIIEQLDNYKVAVNYMNPKDEDYHYKYSDLDNTHKNLILGMAIMCDELSCFEDNREFDINTDTSCETIKKIQNEIEEDVVCRAFNWLVMEMNQSLVAFRDEEVCEKEDAEDEQ